MKMKQAWKKGLALWCAVTLTAGGVSGLTRMEHVQAEETNLFADGDMGDDGSSFWSDNRKWQFEDASWTAADTINYNEWAAAGDSKSGLGINYGKADGTVSIYQNIEALEAGTYTATGWIKDTNGKNGSISLYHGVDSVAGDAVEITTSFQQFTFSFTLEEAVENYKVGFQISSEQEAWVCLDGLQLICTESGGSAGGTEDTNIVYSNDFEDGADLNGWELNWSTQEATSKMDTGAGNNTTTVWNFWTADAQSLTVTRDFTGLEAGNYKASFETAGGNVTGSLKVQAGENTSSAAMTVTAWDVYTTAETGAVSLADGETLTLTIAADFLADGYFKMDNITLTKVSDEAVDAAKKEKLEELKTLVAQYGELTSGDYTEDTWKVLKALLEDNTAYLETTGDSLNFTVAEIEERMTALTAAKDALKSASIVNADIYVEKVEGITEDFIGGVDVSSYVSLKNSGVKYYDFNGKELDDQGFFNLLADSGINYVRVRVWNDPYDANHNGYGGGNNDLATAVKIGQWATKAGMRVLIDFHYSDFWADPEKQQAPKAWQGLSLEQKLGKVTEFTQESLQTLLDAGVDVGMVQVGNETNNGIAGESDWSAGMLQVFAAGCDAVHTTADKNNHPIKAVLHFANPEKGTYVGWAKTLNDAGVNYDVFASSYYPYWHGTLENLQNQLDSIAATYGKEVMVAETSWATTLEDGDGHDNTVRDGNNDTDMPYDFSIYGQAKELRSVIDTIAHTTNGIGVFYWEPAWLPVQVYDAEADNAEEVLAANRASWEKNGSGWAASYAGEYDAKDAGKWYGGSAVDNQALFDFSGHPLDTLNIFKYVKTGATTDVKISTVKTVSAEADLGENIVLPEKVSVTYSDGTAAECEVAWNTEQISAAQQAGAGEYRITGTIVLGDKEYTAVCKLTISPENLLPDGGFESGAEGIWTVEGNGAGIKADSSNVRKGTYCLHFWADTQMNYTATQTVTLKAGVYTFGGYLQGATDGETDTFEIYVLQNGQEQTAQAQMNGWQNWSSPKISDIVVKKDGTEVTFGIRVTAAANAWGSWDDMYLHKTGEVETEPTTAPTATPEATAAPTAAPTTEPTTAPTATPEATAAPTAAPTTEPTTAPTATPEATAAPTAAPTIEPTTAPTATPEATVAPTAAPEATAAPAVSSSEGSSQQTMQTIDWQQVQNAVQSKITELVKSTAQTENGNLDLACNGDIQIPTAVLNSIKGTDVTVALHSGNGVAISVSGQELKNVDLAALQSLDLTVDSSAENIPAELVNSTKTDTAKQLAVKDTGAFPVNVNIHVNVGAENRGKIANLYRYNAEKNRLEYCSSFLVTENGQSMFSLKRGGSYLVTVTETQPQESVYFTEGKYLIKSGDTMAAIAIRNHMSLTELKAKNPQIKDLHKIRVGQKLNLD